MDKTDKVAMVETNKDAVVKNFYESPKGVQPETLELKQHGYLALARGLGSGIYEAAGLPSPIPSPLSRESSGCLELMERRQNNADHIAAAGIGDGLRQSSIDTEPQTLNIISVRRAKVYFLNIDASDLTLILYQ